MFDETIKYNKLINKFIRLYYLSPLVKNKIMNIRRYTLTNII